MVRVLLFAGLRDLAGISIAELPWRADLSITEVRQTLVEKFPNLERLLSQSRVAVADELAEEYAIVPQNAEIAFLPPVSGG